jgi:uncharacterized protein (UPF0335 family)
MIYTSIPRSLIYRDRKYLRDFGVDNDDTLNRQLYLLLRRYLYAELGLNDYNLMIREIFNESYYLCTMLLLEPRPGIHFSDYIEAVEIDRQFTQNIIDLCRRLVYAMSYVFLEKPAGNNNGLGIARRQLRTSSYEFMPLMGEVADFKRPTALEFQPVTITSTLAGTIDWNDVTQGFDVARMEELLSALGKTKEEKRVMIEAIFNAMSESGNLYKIPYQVDAWLYKEYARNGGKREQLLAQNEKSLLKSNREDLTSRISNLETEKYTLLERIRELEQKCNLLAMDKNALSKQLYELKQKEKHSEALNAAQHEKMEEELKQKLSEMDIKVKTLQAKLGTRAVKLSSLVEGVKRYTRVRGLDAGKDIFFSLNYLLMREPVWVDNTEELENFFIENELEKNKPLLQLENRKGGIVQIKSYK